MTERQYMVDDEFRAKVAQCPACYINASGVLVVDPFHTSPVDVDLFAEYDEQRECWHTFRPILVNMRGCPFPLDMADTFEPGRYFCDGQSLLLGVCDGFWWDGASGGVFDNPAVRLDSFVHDIVCDPGEDGIRAVPSYLQRHKLYFHVGIAQGMNPWRARLHFLGLLLGNRPYETFRKLVPQEGVA